MNKPEYETAHKPGRFFGKRSLVRSSNIQPPKPSAYAQEREKMMTTEYFVYTSAITLMGDWIAYLEDASKEGDEAEPDEMIKFFQNQIESIMHAMPTIAEA